MGRVQELKQLSWVRFLLFLREPEAVFWVFLFPVVLALVLGLAFKSRSAETVPVGIVEGNGPHQLRHHPAARGCALVRALGPTGTR